jgi:hypothetical protein
MPSLTSKLSAAIVKVLFDAGIKPGGSTLDIQVNTVLDDAEQSLPCVVCESTRGSEAPQASGNYTLTARVSIHSPGDQGGNEDPVADHDARVSAVLNVLNVDNLATLLSAAVTDFTVFDPVTDRALGPDIHGRAFVDTFEFRAYCCPADIS